MSRLEMHPRWWWTSSIPAISSSMSAGWVSQPDEQIFFTRERVARFRCLAAQQMDRWQDDAGCFVFCLKACFADLGSCHVTCMDVWVGWRHVAKLFSDPEKQRLGT